MDPDAIPPLSSEPSSPPSVHLARGFAALASVIGLGASAALAVPYVFKGTGFCAPGGGCDKVAHSAYATLFGVPRAFLGLFAFALAIVLVVISGKLARRVAPLFGVLMAAEGLHLLGLQLFVIHAICPYCVAIDTSSIVLGLAFGYEALATRRAPAERRTFVPIGVPAVALLVALAPFVIGAVAPKKPAPSLAIAPVPRASDGRVVVREFVDLECPYCRATHVALQKSIAKTGRAVVVDRHHVPLSQHEHAMEAAVAACCAGEQGAEERFVDLVVTTDDAPTESVCRKVALQLALDMSKYDECRKSERPHTRIVKDAELADATKVGGLPTIDVEGERHVGALDEKAAEALLSRHP
jgi:protein-disulfide isomerase/uncharacterized membrane protein